MIYQGSHGDRGAHRADMILPGAAYTEENGLFVNTEGRPQLALRAGFAPGEAKENWAILRALSAELGATQPWDSLAQLRAALVKARAASGPDRRGAGERLAARCRCATRRKADFRTAVERLLPDQPDRPRLGPDGRAVGDGAGARAGAAGGGVGMWRWSFPFLALGLTGCAAGEAPEQDGFGDADLSGDPRRCLLDGDLVNFRVAMTGARARDDVAAYARCAAAQYALIRGYGFARHVRTNVDQKGGVWRGDAVYTISASLPAGAEDDRRRGGRGRLRRTGHTDDMTTLGDMGRHD